MSWVSTESSDEAQCVSDANWQETLDGNLMQVEAEGILSEASLINKEIINLKQETSHLIRDIDKFNLENEVLIQEQNKLKIRLNDKTNDFKNKNTLENQVLKEKLKELKEMMKANHEKYETEKGLLVKTNKNLEESLLLIKKEFEEMENYWQKKIEEERTFFNKQILSEEAQFYELEQKILEYENMLGSKCEETLELSTIVEHHSLEDKVDFLCGYKEQYNPCTLGESVGR